MTSLLEQEMEVIKLQREQKKYFTDRELQEMFGVTAQTTLKWRKQKKIGYLKTPSGTIRYLKKHIDDFEASIEHRAVA